MTIQETLVGKKVNNEIFSYSLIFLTEFPNIISFFLSIFSKFAVATLISAFTNSLGTKVLVFERLILF